MNLLYQPPCHKQIYKKNVFNVCIMIFNKLPDEIKLLPSHKFKSSLTKWLHVHGFYSVKEYMDYNVNSDLL